MRDMGIVHGGAEQAQPLVIGKDTVYVHTDITKLPPDDEFGGELYEYYEIQYGKDEYIKLMAEQNIELESLINTILGVPDDE